MARGWFHATTKALWLAIGCISVACLVPLILGYDTLISIYMSNWWMAWDILINVISLLSCLCHLYLYLDVWISRTYEFTVLTQPLSNRAIVHQLRADPTVAAGIAYAKQWYVVDVAHQGVFVVCVAAYGSLADNQFAGSTVLWTHLALLFLRNVLLGVGWILSARYRDQLFAEYDSAAVTELGSPVCSGPVSYGALSPRDDLEAASSP